MRTRKTILNLVYALGSSLLLMLLGFATRRLLVFNFGNDITAASQVVDLSLIHISEPTRH